MSTPTSVRFAFFGSSRLSVIVLDQLEKRGYIPACVVTSPDKPQGRKLELTANVVKQWAQSHQIKVLDPIKLDADFIQQIKAENCELFIVASYKKIMPLELIQLPAKGTLNIHPSLLPKYRGASPLPSAILDDAKHTGVSIMLIDAEMDHGPIVAQKEITITEWPNYEDFEEQMAREGADLLAETIPSWIHDSITAVEQDHSAATYTRKFTKEDALIDLSADQYINFRKIQAFQGWLGAYFFQAHDTKQLRVKITAASFQDGKLRIEKVVPEGSKEMSYRDFQSGY